MIINPKMWSNRHFVGLALESRLLWCFLLTGNNDGVPGLLRGGPGTYSDAMRWDPDTTKVALDELLRKTFIEYDPGAQLLRVPKAPKYSPCTNANVLKAWFRRWKEVPESPLKYLHIESIRELGDGKAWWPRAWEDTFGQIKVPSPSKQMPLFLVSPVVGSADNKNEELKDSERVSERVPERVPETNTTYTYTSTSIPTSTEPERPKVVDAIERGMIASELWRLQESLRGELAPNVKPREHPTGQDLKPIVEALEIYDREELENSLRVNAAQASNKPEKMEYFNGYSNWHPNSLRRTVGQIVPTSSGRIAVRGRKKFKGGTVI